MNFSDGFFSGEDSSMVDFLMNILYLVNSSMDSFLVKIPL